MALKFFHIEKILIKLQSFYRKFSDSTQLKKFFIIQNFLNEIKLIILDCLSSHFYNFRKTLYFIRKS